MRKQKIGTFAVGGILLIAALGGFLAAQGQKSAEELYQSALLVKQGEGDLEKAIKLFQKILADFPKDRAAGGKAQLQIGLCYEKLGEAKAQEAFNKVLADFQDQPDVVRVAKERLAAMVRPTPEAAPRSGGLSLRQVDYPDGLISPDGHWIALGETESNIVLYDTGTKKRTEITHHPESSSRWIDGFEWAPSSRRLAYVRPESETETMLRIVDVNGAKDVSVFKRSGGFTTLDIIGWAPDEKAVFLIIGDSSDPKRRQTLGKCSIQTGEFTEIHSYEGSAVGKSKLSPDGHFIAFTYFAPRGTSAGNKILTLSVNSKTETLVYEHPILAVPEAWTMDSNGLLFSSRRGGADALWLLPLQDGRAGGEVQLVQEFSNRIHVNGWANGSVYLAESISGGEDSYTIQIDLAAGKTLKAPAPVEKDYKGVTSSAFWSPDGRSIAYLFQSSLRRQPLLGEYDTLRIRSLESGQTRDFRSPVKNAPYYLPRWSLDGESIFIYGLPSKPGSKGGLFKVNAETGESTLLVENRSGTNSIVAWSSNGEIVYWAILERGATPSDSRRKLTRMNLRTTEEKEIWRDGRGERFGGPMLSEDEKWIAFLVHKPDDKITRICVIPSEGGEARVVFESKEKNLSLGAYCFWGPGDKGILFRKTNTTDEGRLLSELWYIPNWEKPEPRKLDFPPQLGLDQVRFHPDGRTIAFKAAGSYGEKRWVLENFLPSVKSPSR
jgi:Tol biopolymer transport system component